MRDSHNSIHPPGHKPLHGQKRVPPHHLELLPPAFGISHIYVSIHGDRVVNSADNRDIEVSHQQKAIAQGLVVMDNVESFSPQNASQPDISPDAESKGLRKKTEKR
jgi:hypothetical protein